MKVDFALIFKQIRACMSLILWQIDFALFFGVWDVLYKYFEIELALV